MSMKGTGIWILAVVAAGVLGWYAAMATNRGAAFSSEEDAYERFSNALTLTDTMDRIDVLSRLIRRLTPEVLPGAIRAYEDDVEDVVNNDLKMLMWYWAQVDPRGMMQRVEGWAEVRTVKIAAGEAIYWILRKEGYDAANKIYVQMPSDLRTAALPHMILAYLESSEHPNLIELIESYDSREERDRVAGIVVGQMLRLNRPEDLTRWVESLPDGGSSMDVKRVAYRAAVSDLLRHRQFDFVEAWLARVGEEGWAKPGWRAVAIHLVWTDPMKAIEWVKAKVPVEDRSEVYGDVQRAFARTHRDAALIWLRTQTPEPAIDPCAARLAYEFALPNPDIAREMILRIQDPLIFENIRKTLVREWASLPAEQQKKLLSGIEPRGNGSATAAPSQS